MEVMIYPIVVFLATSLGATTGAGGGAIIKPVFDLIGIDNVTVISYYSTIAVFTMCVVSIMKHLRNGQKFDWKIMIGLSMGSILGGSTGEFVFKLVTAEFNNQMVTRIQASILLTVFVMVFLYTRNAHNLNSLKIRNLGVITIIGFIVGAISVFLGIGGGPLNVVVLLGLMSFTAKESTVYSIAMIFFAQVLKIGNVILIAQSGVLNLTIVFLIIIIAILGGYFGTKINHYLSEKQVTNVYSLMMVGLIVICVINIVRNLT